MTIQVRFGASCKHCYSTKPTYHSTTEKPPTVLKNPWSHLKDRIAIPSRRCEESHPTPVRHPATLTDGRSEEDESRPEPLD
jgi:hypothetical protein